jgi:hypothetical protein
MGGGASKKDDIRTIKSIPQENTGTSQFAPPVEHKPDSKPNFSNPSPSPA